MHAYLFYDIRLFPGLPSKTSIINKQSILGSVLQMSIVLVHLQEVLSFIADNNQVWW